MLQGYVGSFCHIKKKERKTFLSSFVCVWMEKPDVQVPVRSMKSVLVRGQDEGSALTGEIHRKLQRN